MSTCRHSDKEKKRRMERPNRFKGFICSDIGAGIGECAEDGFRLSLTPLSHFLARISRGKGCRRADIRDNERKIKKNFNRVSMW